MEQLGICYSAQAQNNYENRFEFQVKARKERNKLLYLHIYMQQTHTRNAH